ncbi:MAG: pyridoxal phosphate-dependent aminotransferase [Devosia sp.]|nr:pyridoxal phosphate-dependent aminotransferase [Devosia sp.]
MPELAVPFRRADRLKRIAISASAAMSDKARELKAAGINVISLSSGEPDFATPSHAMEAAHKAALAGDTKYPPQTGSVALLKAVQRKFSRENGLDYALDEILTGNGAKQIIFDAIVSTCNAGDEVIIPTPGWITYADIVNLAEATPVSVACRAEYGFQLRAEDLEEAITPKTRWLILNFPNNPSGTTGDEAQLRAIADVLLRHPHVWVLTDDIYEHLTYDDTKFVTIAQLEPALKNRTLTVNGVSKAYAMTGWRVGYCGGPRELISAMNVVQLQATGGIATVAQAAAVAVLDGPQGLLREQAEIYRGRRDLVLKLLGGARGIECHRPSGAFYVYANVSGTIGRTTAGGTKINNDVDFVTALLGEKHVAAVQGAAYGMSPYVRLSYATDTESLREACSRIVDFCNTMV